MTIEAGAVLLPHPSVASPPLRSIRVEVERDRALLRLRYRFEGDLARIRVPAPATPAPSIGLWEHTCAEAFVAGEEGDAYHELNFSPSGEWAAFAFSSYRAIGALDDVVPPRIVSSSDDARLEMMIEVDLARLSPTYAAAPLRLGLSAVVETLDGGLSCWSLVHPPGQPDFHQRDTRVLRLPASERGAA